jgi:hypothetical protein
MEIHSFKIFITDADLASLTARLLREQDNIERLQVRMTPEGVLVQGEYPTSFLKVPFETIWQLGASGPVVQVRLASVKVAGLPAGIFRGALMKMVRDAVAGETGITVQEETIAIHVPEVARKQGVDVAVQFKSVRLSIGSAVIEAGPAE